jgi:acyl carrier protein
MRIEEKVHQLMSDKGCGLLPVKDISNDGLLFELGFDSLRYMELVVLLEETFEIAIPDELLEITPQTTVKTIVEAIRMQSMADAEGG